MLSADRHCSSYRTELPLPTPLQELRDLVKRLLVRSTGRRLGCTSGGATEVKQHPWFK